MTTNGPRFLERTRDEFLKDLRDSFGERSGAFTEDLRVLLFEMWVRARSRPPFPEHRPEPTDEMKQAELEVRLWTAFSNISSRKNMELALEFVLAVQRSITTGAGIIRLDKAEALNLTLDPGAELDQEAFAKMLDQVLKLEGAGLEKLHDGVMHQVELKFGGTGVVAPSVWVPVFQHVDTGVRSGIDVLGSERHIAEQIDTLLVHDGANWLFPNPKPVHTYDNNSHVKLFVDGVVVPNSAMTWHNGFDTDRGCQLIEGVQVPSGHPGSQVRAVYSTVLKEYGT